MINSQSGGYIQTPGTGTATVFSAPFKCFAASDVVVGVVTNGVYAQQFSGYTVTNIDVDEGFTVTFSTAPAAGTMVDLRTSTPNTQGTNFANLGAYLPENTTEALDRLTRMVQDLYRKAYLFGFHGPDNENTVWPALPGALARAGMQPIFDSNGLPSVGITPSSVFTQANFNSFLGTSGPYAVTPAEVLAAQYPISGAAAVPTIVFSPQYPPGNIRRYGSTVGTGGDDRLAIIYAISQCLQLGGAGVFFPRNAVDYFCSATVNITLPTNIAANPAGSNFAALHMRGETDRGSTVGPKITFNSLTGMDGFTVFGTGALSGTCENLAFGAGAATAPYATALWHISPASPGGPNSFYFFKCWFQSPPWASVIFEGSDDFKMEGCTSDVNGNYGLVFGLTKKATNVSVIGHTNYMPNPCVGIGILGNVEGFEIDGRFYSYQGANTNTPQGWNLRDFNTGTGVQNGAFTGEYDYVNNVLVYGPNCGNVKWNAEINNVQNAPAILLGGGIVTDLEISGVAIRGFAGPGKGLIDATGTSVQNCVIADLDLYGNNGPGTITFTTPLVTGATSGVFTPAITTGVYTLTLSDNETVTATVTTGSGATTSSATWTGGITGNNIATATANGTSGYCINAPATNTSNNKIADNAYVGWTSAPLAIATYVNNGVTESGTFPVTTTGMNGATGTVKYAVNNDTMTLSIPALNGTAGGATACTINGLPSYMWPATTKNFQCIVTNAGANVQGNLSIGSSGVMTLTVGTNGGAFTGTSSNGVQPFDPTVLLN